jgi:CRISPR/Cas system-associated exonuclease Cas4 (RecB family)
MSKNLTDDYEQLISYLESQTKKASTMVVEPEKISDVKSDTKKIIEECSEIHSDVPLFKNKITSEGFDVFKFENLMRTKLIDGHIRGQSYERPYISVSELYSCIRKTYYNRMKYNVNLDKQYQFSYLYLINNVGNTVHDLVQSLYSHTEVEKTIISEKYKVKGRVDGIIDNFLLEYKTIDKDKFKNKHQDVHYIQGIIYAYILNTEYNYKIDTITIVYILRDLKRIVPFDLPLDNERAQKFLRRAPVILKNIYNKVVPEPIGSDKEQCNWCSYKKYCLEDKTERLQPFKKIKENKNKTKKTVFLL